MSRVAAFACVLEVELLIRDAAGLKDKRRVVRRALDRVRAKFNAAAAEVGDLGDASRASLAFAVLSNSEAHAHQQAQRIADFLEALPLDAEIGDISTETILL